MAEMPPTAPHANPDADLLCGWLRLLMLLRGDVAAPDPADPRAFLTFLTWWELHGRDEYPALDAQLGPDSYQNRRTWLEEEAPGVVQDALLPITRFMYGIWLLRQDVRDEFDLTLPEGRQGLIRWCLTDGPAAYPGRMPLSARWHGGEDLPAAPQALLPLVTLIGFARGEFGIAEDVRMVAASLEAVGVPYEVYPLHASTHRAEDRRLDHRLTDRPVGKINLFCVTGFDTVDLFLRHPEIFAGRRNIGYWPWELAEWPDDWLPAFGLIDEVWASSRFIQDAMSLKSPVPVVYMPMAVSVETEDGLTRASFGLAEERFQFLYVFDWNSFSARKNPFAAIQAFQLAFPDLSHPVGLVLKTMGLDETSPQGARLLVMAREDPRVTLLNQTLDRSTLLSLIALCDATVSLHRSEGFGRTLAEAMLLKRPVIATDYSGNTDFCQPNTCALVPASLIPVGPAEYPHSRGQVWAEPSIAAAAEAMRKVATDASYRAAIVAAGHALVHHRHDPRVVGARYRQRLAASRQLTEERPPTAPASISPARDG